MYMVVLSFIVVVLNMVDFVIEVGSSDVMSLRLC